MFFGGHPQAASLGELNLIGKAIKLRQLCTCGSEISQCGAWGAVFDELAERGRQDFRTHPYAFGLWPARARVLVDREHQDKSFERSFKLRQAWLIGRSKLPPTARRLLPLPAVMKTALTNKIDLYNIIAKRWNRSLIVDSSKSPWEAVELVKRVPNQVKVVLLTRDGRGVYHSRRSSGFSREESVAGWKNYYKRALPMLMAELGPENLLNVRYEDFARNPDSTGRNLCDWLGLPYEPRMLDLGAADRHMVNGNDTRFKPQQGIKLDERWRKELLGDELMYFNQHGLSINGLLGYS